MTLGEYRVGVDFNPSNNDLVAQIKQAAANLIDLINTAGVAHPLEQAEPEVQRLKALGMTAIEEGAMWGVKAATKRHALASDMAPSARQNPPATPDDPFVRAIARAVTEWDAAGPAPSGALEALCMAELRKEGFLAVAPEDIFQAIKAVRGHA